MKDFEKEYKRSFMEFINTLRNSDLSNNLIRCQVSGNFLKLSRHLDSFSTKIAVEELWRLGSSKDMSIDDMTSLIDVICCFAKVENVRIYIGEKRNGLGDIDLQLCYSEDMDANDLELGGGEY